MRFIPKVEMQWTAPRVFGDAMNTSSNRDDPERLVLRIGVWFGCMLAYCKFFVVWVKTTFEVEAEVPAPLLPQLTSLPVWFAVGILLGYGLKWLISIVPNSYRIVGGRIELQNGNRRFPFDTIERASLQNFGAFRVLAVEVRERGRVLMGAPADIDFEKLRSLFESRGIAFESTGPATRWPAKSAIQAFDRLVSSTDANAKSHSKAKRDAFAGPPGAIVLLRSAIVIAGLIAIMMSLGLFFRRANDDWDRQILRYETMKQAAIQAKADAGSNWPKVRQRYVGPLDEQAAIMKAAGNRTLNRAYVAGIFSFIAFLGVFYAISGTCFTRLDDS